MDIELETWVVIVSTPNGSDDPWPVVHMCIDELIKHAKNTAIDKSVLKSIRKNKEGRHTWNCNDWIYTSHYRKARIRVVGI